MSNLALNKLDIVLNFLKDTTDIDPIDLEVKLLDLFPNISGRDKKAIIDKLLKDGYIDNIIPNFDKFIKDRKYQFITFDGLLLLQDNGYVGKKKKEELIPRMLLMTQTLTMIGILVSASHYIVEFCYPFRHHLPCQEKVKILENKDSALNHIDSFPKVCNDSLFFENVSDKRVLKPIDKKLLK